MQLTTFDKTATAICVVGSLYLLFNPGRATPPTGASAGGDQWIDVTSGTGQSWGIDFTSTSPYGVPGPVAVQSGERAIPIVAVEVPDCDAPYGALVCLCVPPWQGGRTSLLVGRVDLEPVIPDPTPPPTMISLWTYNISSQYGSDYSGVMVSAGASYARPRPPLDFGRCFDLRFGATTAP